MAEEGEKPDKSRWWDHYYVRYFVGAVFAVPLMLSLSRTDAVKGLLGTVDQNKVLDATVLGAAGLAFCYIASAPILLLHALRGRHQQRAAAKGTLSAGSIFFGIVTLIASIVLGGWIAWDVEKPVTTFTWLSFLPLGIVVWAQAILILRTPTDRIADFYRKLASDRAQEAGKGLHRREYIQSYRDMREHGNALLILIMEGVLTAALLKAPNAGALFAMLVLWVFPASFVWFIATRLEGSLHEVK